MPCFNSANCSSVPLTVLITPVKAVSKSEAAFPAYIPKETIGADTPIVNLFPKLSILEPTFWNLFPTESKVSPIFVNFEDSLIKSESLFVVLIISRCKYLYSSVFLSTEEESSCCWACFKASTFLEVSLIESLNNLDFWFNKVISEGSNLSKVLTPFNSLLKLDVVLSTFLRADSNLLVSPPISTRRPLIFFILAMLPLQIIKMNLYQLVLLLWFHFLPFLLLH